MSRGIDAMKKLLLGIILLSLLTGCSTMTGVTTGTVTTSYDVEGRVQSTVTEEAIGDPNTEFYGSVRTVAEQTANNIKSRADAIQKATAPAASDTGEVRAWKAAFGALAISQIDDSTAKNIAAVSKPTTGYDVGMEAVKVVRDVAQIGLPVYGAVKAVKYLSEQVGDTIQSSTDGDSNSTSFETSKSHVNSPTTAASYDNGTATANPTATSTNASPATTEMVEPEPIVEE
jgi:hypothetical protein